jgi:hypothetical protein
MEGREKVVEAGRADEILIESHQLAGIAVGEAEVEVDDLLRTDSDLGRDQSHYSLVVLAEDFPLVLEMLLQLLLHCLGVKHWLQVVLLVWLELLPFGTEMDGQVGNFEQGLSRAPQLGSVFSLILINHPACEDEVAIEPGVPQAAAVSGHVALVYAAIGSL